MRNPFDITDAMQHEYKENHLLVCPRCNQSDLTVDEISNEGGLWLTKQVSCEKCRASWEEHFKFDQIDNLEIPYAWDRE